MLDSSQYCQSSAQFRHQHPPSLSDLLCRLLSSFFLPFPSPSPTASAGPRICGFHHALLLFALSHGLPSPSATAAPTEQTRRSKRRKGKEHQESKTEARGKKKK